MDEPLSLYVFFFPRCPGGWLSRWRWSEFCGPGGSSGPEVGRDVSDESTGEEPGSLEPAAEIRSEHSAGPLGRRYNTHLNHR